MTSDAPDAAGGARRLIQRYGWIAVGISLLLAVYLLPPDTSLAQVQRRGQLAACVPEARPPWVTGEAATPGIEVELLEALAHELGVRLTLNTVPAMTGGFNPRSWRITRAQCDVVGGGLVDTPETRAFLAAGPAYAETGWMAVAPGDPTSMSGRTVGVLVTLQGADRIALSAYLRSAGARAAVVRDRDALAAGLADGSYDVGIAVAPVARAIAQAHGWASEELPPPLTRQVLILGLWKGDLTLKRALESAFERVAGDGRLAGILARY